MPIRILVIGLLYCIAGVLAIREVVADLMQDDLNLNFGVFLLPVGIGLVRGKSGSRAWVKFWTGLGSLLVVVIVIFPFVNATALTADWFGEKIRGSRAVPYTL